jgi:hypothetical protein
LIADLPNAGVAVGAEDPAEQLRNEIIEFFTLVQVGDGGTLGARRIMVLQATGPHLAPSGLLIFPATGTSSAAVSAARPAIQAAAGDQCRVRNKWLHLLSSLPFRSVSGGAGKYKMMNVELSNFVV